jgi:hypothetical protein
MRIRMRDLADGDGRVLAGAINGRKAVARLLELTAREPDQPDTVFLDFEGVDVATASFLRESVLAFRDAVRPQARKNADSQVRHNELEYPAGGSECEQSCGCLVGMLVDVVFQLLHRRGTLPGGTPRPARHVAGRPRCPQHAALGDHSKALQSALTDGISRFGSDTGRGHGFRPIFLGLANLRGSLRFRSGDHALVIDGTSPSLMTAKLG